MRTALGVRVVIMLSGTVSIGRADLPINMLKPLPPLQKVHYSYAIDNDLLTAPPAELIEVLRICRAVGISLQSSSDAAVVAAGNLARALNIEVSINFSPRSTYRPPVRQIPSYQQELIAEQVEFGKRLGVVKTLLGPCRVGAVLIDDERFDVRPEIMLPYRNAIYKLAKDSFSSASVEYYAFGAVVPVASSRGWGSSHFLGTEQTDAWSVPLYKVSLTLVSEESFRRTVAGAPAGKPVTPWLAFGCGYEPQIDMFHRWTPNWDYEYKYDWLLGQEINIPWFGAGEDNAARFAPWARATHCALYPAPFNSWTTKWVQHFIAYCRGAASIKSLDGLD